MIANIFKANSISFSFILLIIFLSLITSGCSPHPGAGNWKADGSNTLNVSRIKVVFEGTADFYRESNNVEDASEESIRRCFWSAVGKNALQMQCVHSDNTDKKETYQFTVTETGQAKLNQNDQLIGLFSVHPQEK